MKLHLGIVRIARVRTAKDPYRRLTAHHSYLVPRSGLLVPGHLVIAKV